MLNSLALCSGIVIAVSFEQVDDAPYCNARSDGGYDGFECCYAVSEKSHFLIEHLFFYSREILYFRHFRHYAYFLKIRNSDYIG